MEPEIKSKPAFTVVGIKCRGKNENNEIPQLWFKLGPRMNEIKHRVGPAYGVMDNYDEGSGTFDYIAGIEVDSSADIPEGMVSIDVPEQTYAVFTTTLPTLVETYQRVCKTWLPQSDYKRVHGPEFELYDATFNPADETSELYVYIPVTKK
ncbi:MAG: AraC family transcriptional regulator [Theionarchaea archaeon]|nr:AraC family transcriptional regulator [Theionarchaea archaeon]